MSEDKDKGKPTMSLKSRFIYGESYISPACPEADALFTLLGRQTIKPADLHLIGKMGFKVDISGEQKELKKAISKLEIELEQKL